jgi:quercetin dioxygenase-like cupin family protein
MTVKPDLPAATALELDMLISYTERGIASRVLARNSGGNVTLFAFDAGQELSEHTSPHDALVMVLEGTLMLNVGGTSVRAAVGTVVRIPSGVPHAVESSGRSKMLLVMLQGRKS